MTKKHFIALADAIRAFTIHGGPDMLTQEGQDVRIRTIKAMTNMLADFCREQNPQFDENRWINYIAGNCGPNGRKAAAR